MKGRSRATEVSDTNEQLEASDKVRVRVRAGDVSVNFGIAGEERVLIVTPFLIGDVFESSARFTFRPSWFRGIFWGFLDFSVMTQEVEIEVVASV